MKKTSLKCPYCSTLLSNTVKSDEYYCSHCKRFVMLEDWADSLDTKRSRDDKVVSWELKERSSHIKFLRWIIIFACLFAIAFGISAVTHVRSVLEERNLQRTVDAIMVDIENEDYAAARIKANSLYYTTGESDDVEYKWDNIRWQLLEDIDEAEEKSEKANKRGILDLFKKEDDQVESSTNGFSNNP